MEKKIYIDQVEPGMVLARAVKNSSFQTLIPAGVTLRENYVKILHKQNIEYIFIKEADTGAKQEPKAEGSKSPASVRLEQRITWEPSNKFEKEIYKIALKKSAKVIISQDFE